MKKTPSESNLLNRFLSRNSGCRICGGQDLTLFFSLGSQPPANAFLAENRLRAPEASYPLDVYLCADCGLVQLLDIVSPEVLFKDYVYVSSTSPAFVAHFETFARSVFDRETLNSRSLVVDIGSNDGILLRPFRTLGVRVLGVDPAEKIAKQATESGIETWPAFFDREVARRIVEEKGTARVVTACNVFAHVNDLHGFVDAVKVLLAPNGVFVPEFPYLADFYEQNLFDTIYHEHLSYLALRPLLELFRRSDMEIFDAHQVRSHGGSLRLFVQKAGGIRTQEAILKELLRRERDLGLDRIETWRAFERRGAENRSTLLSLLKKLKSEGRKIMGYGAPAKGNTLLNYFGIGPEILCGIVDDSSLKQGLYTPGTHIQVVSPGEIERAKPDYILILAWNFADSIMAKLSRFKDAGGRFILPVPRPRIM